MSNVLAAVMKMTWIYTVSQKSKPLDVW